MSNTTKILTMSMLTLAMIFSPLGALAQPNFAPPNHEPKFLELNKAIVDINDEVITDIIFKAQGKIPINNPGINWGYGIVTADNNVIVTTSHPDLKIVDSELQNGDDTNDVIHNHYAILGENQICADEGFNPPLGVVDLTFKSPGKIFVKDNEALLKKLPGSVEGGNFDPMLIFTPGSDVQAAASFQLQYVPEDPMDPMNENFAVCVTDLKTLDPTDNSFLIIGEKDFHEKNERPYGNEHNGEYGYSQERPYGNEHNGESEYSQEKPYEHEYLERNYETSYY